LKEFFGVKQSNTTRAIIETTLGQPVWTPKDYANFAREGYCNNVYVYACVRHTHKHYYNIPLGQN